MKLSDHQWEFLKDVSLLIIFALRKGYKLTGGELWRPQMMQDYYFANKKSKTKKGNHPRRLAIDFNVFLNGILLNASSQEDWDKIKVLGDYWESLNKLNRWGGDWNKNDIKDGFVDNPHFERNV